MGWRRRSLGGGSVHHQGEALFGGGELGNVVLGVGTADVLLHGTVSFLLYSIRRTLLGLFWVMVAVTCGGKRADSGIEAESETEGGGTHACAALPTSRAIMVAERTDNDIVLVRHRERPCERGSRRHSKLHLPSGRGPCERWVGGGRTAAGRAGGAGRRRKMKLGKKVSMAGMKLSAS